MLKRFLCISLVVFAFTSLLGQDKKEIKKEETKMDLFASRTGVITKFTDYKLSGIKMFLGEKAETRVRKVTSGGESRYFYQIERRGEYSNATASVEYTDLLEVIKAFQVLKKELANDAANKPDYLENKFTTVDGFQVGYYVEGSKAKWYLQLERYGTNKTIFLNDADTIENGLQEAKNKIEELNK